MDREVSSTPESKKIERKTFLKGAAATAAAVAGSGALAGIAKAHQVEVISSAPSGEATIWVQTNLFTDGQVAAFNKRYPDVTIKQVKTPYVPGNPSYSSHLVTGVDVPDAVFFIEDAYIGQYAPVLYDVGKFVAPYANKIAPYKLAVSKQQGKTVAIPWDVDPVWLIYNMDIFGKAGVDVSKIVTHDDLVAAAQQIKAKVPTCKTPIMFGADSAHVQMQVEAMVWQQHSGIVDAKGNLNIMSQEYTNAFQYLEKAAKAGVMAPPYLFATPSLYNAWIKGQVAMVIFADWWSHWNASGLKPLIGKIGLAKQPVFTPGKDSPYSMMGGSAYVVPLKAKNPEAGAVFGTFQLFEPAALKLGDASAVYSAVLPAAEALWPDVQLDAFRHKELLNSTIPEHDMLVTAALNAPATYRYPPWYSQAFPYYSPHVLNLVRGKISAVQAQKQIYDDVLNKVVKRYHA